jgi:hypothetical protein
MADGTRRIVGYTEASRGCKHLCRHCPIVPVYDGRFRAIPVDVVLADVRAQVAAGAQHITFGDPDFFNGVTHALRVVRGIARDWGRGTRGVFGSRGRRGVRGISYDVTIKIEHLVRHADALPELAATGCAFITSAVESIDDAVLEKLRKGHTRADFEKAVALCRDAGVPLAPTFVAFTPWSTLAGYAELLDAIDRLDLVEHVAPIQLAIRLLITQESPLLELPDIRAVAGPFNARTLTHPWRHADPEVDRLQRGVEALVGRRLNAPRRQVFQAVRALVDPHNAECQWPNAEGVTDVPLVARATIPYLTEPWYC